MLGTAEIMMSSLFYKMDVLKNVIGKNYMFNKIEVRLNIYIIK